MAKRDSHPQSDAKAPVPSPSRRSLLTSIWIGLLGLASLEFLWVFTDLLRPRRRRVAEDGSVLVAGPVDRFEPGSVTPFPQGKLYLARLEDGGFLALSRRCTHLGCTLPWDREASRFVCPCHASSFDRRGEVISPPAPRALDLFEVRIENAVVKVHTGRIVSRQAFDASQVVYPEGPRA